MTENGFEYVDLGLPSGTMWATCNVGADKPEYLGLLFQFGRVDGYGYLNTFHKFKTTKQNLEDGSTSKYVPVLPTGNTYKVGEILKPEDDAAHAHMGGKWKMPTKDELHELVDNTSHEVEIINGVKGMMFISKKNGKQIFIPFAGFWYNESFYALGSSTNVWSSQVHSSSANFAYILSCNSGGNVYADYFNRYCAFSVRGVFKK